MHAVVEIAGVQFEVTKSQMLNVPLLEANIGENITFNNILLTKDGNDVQVGTPYLSGSVTAQVIEHGKDKTVLVFHKKRRKGYRKLNGHRQKYTQIEITDIKA